MDTLKNLNTTYVGTNIRKKKILQYIELALKRGFALVFLKKNNSKQYELGINNIPKYLLK